MTPDRWYEKVLTLTGRAVLTSVVGFYFRAFDEVTIDGTTQTAFTGDTNPDGHEVAIYGLTLYLNADNCTLIGFDSTSVSVNGSNCLIEGNTGTMGIDVFGGSCSLIKDNQGSTIKIDRSHDNVVVGNVVSRVRVLGGGPDATGNRIGGPTLAERNIIKGYGTYNSEGLPSGSTVQLFRTVDTLIENNWIGTPDGVSYGNLASTQGILLESHNENVTIRDNLISGIKGLGIGPHWPGFLFGRAVLASGSGDGLVMTGNVIGLDIHGDPTLGSVTGLDLGDPVTHPLSMTNVVIGGAGPGDGNEIGGHILNGVLVGHNTQNVRLAGNSIHDNGQLGIDLVANLASGTGVSPNDPLDADTGGNGLQNYPVIASVLRQGDDLEVTGTLGSSAGDTFTLEFFGSPECDDSGHGEGRLPLGATSVTTNAAGSADFEVLLPAVEPGGLPGGWVVTATATREPTGATSEFSACAATCWRDEGFALAGVAGEPRLRGVGDLSAGRANSLRLSEAAPGALSGLFASTSGNPTPFYGSMLLTVPILLPPVVLSTDAQGTAQIPFVMPAGAPSGLELWLQWVVTDAAAPFGYALSNGLVGTLP